MTDTGSGLPANEPHPEKPQTDAGSGQGDGCTSVCSQEKDYAFVCHLCDSLPADRYFVIVMGSTTDCECLTTATMAL